MTKDVKKQLAKKAGSESAVTATVKDLLTSDAYRNRFEDILGEKAAGFVASVINAVNSNPALREAVPITVVSAAAVAATLDLPVDPNLGFAYIIPYRDNRRNIVEAQFQLGYKGYVQLALRTGQYRTMNAIEIYKGELVGYDRLSGELILDESQVESGEIMGYAAHFSLVNGFVKNLYWTVDQVKAHGKKYSKSYNSPKGQWKQNFDAMAKKTVLKMLLSQYGILSIEMQTAIKTDQAVVRDFSSPEQIDLDYVDNEGYVDAEFEDIEIPWDEENREVKK